MEFLPVCRSNYRLADIHCFWWGLKDFILACEIAKARDYNREVKRLRMLCYRRLGGFRVLLSVLLFVFVSRSLGAQTPVGSNDRETFLESATRAFAHGNRDEIETLAERFDPDMPEVVAFRARLLIERGDYAQAEAMLRPVVTESQETAAGLELGLLLQTQGQIQEARVLLDSVIVHGLGSLDSFDQYRGALAARAVGSFREANRLFRAAAQSAPDNPAIQTSWGQLFLEKYNHPDALASFQAALALDDQWAPAHLGVAQVLASENPPVARSSVERALEIDPRFVSAHLFTAELALDDSNRDAAGVAIAEALAINPKSLEALSLLAAIAYLEDRAEDYEAEVARAHAVNPVYGEIYRIVGSRTARAYRFPEAVSLAKRALELNPGNTRAYADLGMHLLRTGDEVGAREALDKSFEDDPFDIVTYNLLQMMDQLSEFETFEQGDLIVRIHPDEAPALKEYVLETAQEALDELTVRYGMTVQAPILVEIFPRHDDFAVRTLGLPGMLGALGACFGNVVTLDSPRARPPGDFNWLSTLWHEMAHVVTLQMSNQRLPRWLSEGISTYEEKRKQVAWGRDSVVDFAVALNEGSVLSIQDLNSGFARPEIISLTYFQASILVEHLIETHGMPAMREILLAYGEGLETDEALARVGLDYESLQASFDKAVEEDFGDLRLALETPEEDIPSEGPERLEVLRSLAVAHGGNFHVQVALGEAALEDGANEEARKALERAASLVPMATGFDSPRGLLARIAQDEGDRGRALRELEMLLEYDETSIDAVRLYASLAEEAGDQFRLGKAYERLIEIDPFDPIAHQVLGRMALRDGRAALATRELTVALSLDPVDRVAAHTDLAESLLLSENFAEAKSQAMAALEIAPSYERAQELLLTIIETEP